MITTLHFGPFDATLDVDGVWQCDEPTTKRQLNEAAERTYSEHTPDNGDPLRAMFNEAVKVFRPNSAVFVPDDFEMPEGTVF